MTTTTNPYENALDHLRLQQPRPPPAATPTAPVAMGYPVKPAPVKGHVVHDAKTSAPQPEQSCTTRAQPVPRRRDHARMLLAMYCALTLKVWARKVSIRMAERRATEAQRQFEILELLLAQPGLHVFALARANRYCASRAREHLHEFLDRLVVISNYMGNKSAERAREFWENNERERRAYPYRTNGPYLSYQDRLEWHPTNGGVGSTWTEDWDNMRTFDQVFATDRTKEYFVNAAAAAALGLPRTLCKPLFVYGPINFHKRMAVRGDWLYDAVVHGVTPQKKANGKNPVNKHQRFLLRRVLEAREATQA